MYAVVETGGKQIEVRPGEVVEVEKLLGKAGEKVVFDRVLMVNDGKKISIGTPVVAGSRVVGKIVEQTKGPKVRIFTYKRRKNIRRRMGHRQPLTQVEVVSIEMKKEKPKDGS